MYYWKGWRHYGDFANKGGVAGGKRPVEIGSESREKGLTRNLACKQNQASRDFLLQISPPSLAIMTIFQSRIAFHIMLHMKRHEVSGKCPVSIFHPFTKHHFISYIHFNTLGIVRKRTATLSIANGDSHGRISR